MERLRSSTFQFFTPIARLYLHLTNLAQVRWKLDTDSAAVAAMPTTPVGWARAVPTDSDALAASAPAAALVTPTLSDAVPARSEHPRRPLRSRLTVPEAVAGIPTTPAAVSVTETVSAAVAGIPIAVRGSDPDDGDRFGTRASDGGRDNAHGRARNAYRGRGRRTNTDRSSRRLGDGDSLGC